MSCLSVFFVCFLSVFLGFNQYYPGVFMVLWVLCSGTPEGSPAVVLALKRARKRGPGLKSPPTDWEQLESEPVTSGLQDKGFSLCLWPCSLAITSTGRLGFCGFMSRGTRRLTCSGSGFKTSQKAGNSLKYHPTDWEKPGIEPATPCLQDIGLYPTPRRLFSSVMYMNSPIFINTPFHLVNL